MLSQESLQWLQASLLPEHGPVRLKQLFECPEQREPFFSTLPELLPGSCRKTVDACQEWAALPGNSIIGLTDDEYPPLLLQTPDPPPVLFVRGTSETLCLPQIAMVGSRKPSPEGRRLARDFARGLSDCGYVVTSGLALGIDSDCHQAVVQATGKTVAVLGSGLDCIYPRSHAALAQQILLNNGALVSEFLPDCRPHAGNFPRRNRIISGLAHGVVVVEAALQSGSLITARLAAEQGREVFSIPGSVRNPLTRGCHSLIRRGAKLTESVEDILEELPAMLGWERSRSRQEPAGSFIASTDDELSAEARELFRHLGHDPVTADALAEQSGLDIAKVAASLVLLELSGRVEQHEGRFVLRGG